ncbi:helix-turn-helix transcriptional regulator [Paenibacillus sp. FSL P4-0176]|uniref:helix-turn-helix domain-containing protein n=1 Tax=Paenibacillus sp. FSL P4-0176 TaxID=2921631 RepID=UPI0030D52526
MSKIDINLDSILEELNISKNKLAVEAKLRPNLITEMSDGKTKAIKLETLATLLDTINRISATQDGKVYDVADLFIYTPDIIRVRFK